MMAFNSRALKAAPAAHPSSFLEVPDAAAVVVDGEEVVPLTKAASIVLGRPVVGNRVNQTKKAPDHEQPEQQDQQQQDAEKPAAEEKKGEAGAEVPPAAE